MLCTAPIPLPSMEGADQHPLAPATLSDYNVSHPPPKAFKNSDAPSLVCDYLLIKVSACFPVAATNTTSKCNFGAKRVYFILTRYSLSPREA